jgi:hypothetical protein
MLIGVVYNFAFSRFGKPYPFSVQQHKNSSIQYSINLFFYLLS